MDLRNPPPDIDTETAHPARMYDAYLGGTTNYAADRAAVRQVLRAAPEMRDLAVANRAFLRRAVRFLVGEAGIRQILDIGAGIPTVDTVHEIADDSASGARVVYVDNDPVVLKHADQRSTNSSATRTILADLREPERILASPDVRELIDFDRPVALLLVAVLHFITDDEAPSRLVATLRNALPTGSYLALSHSTADLRAKAATMATAVYDQATAPVRLRSHEQIAAFFDGFDLIEPGLVQAPLWRPDGEAPNPKDLERIWLYAGVGRLADARPAARAKCRARSQDT
jgi:hypothetical protein